MITVLVTGGRHYGDPSLGRGQGDAARRAADAARARAQREHLRDTLCELHARTPIGLLVQGGAQGADRYALAWAMSHRVPHRTFRAQWDRHGRGAGPIRNRRMLAEGHPDLVVAFEGGAGTADMVLAARSAGVEVVECPLLARPAEGHGTNTSDSGGKNHDPLTTKDSDNDQRLPS